MKHTSVLIDKPCELINITPMNPLISRCCIKVLYIGENRNGSVISKEVATQIANSLPGSPIVGYFNENTGDFEEHNRRIDIAGGTLKISDTTKAYGFVDLGAKVWFQDYLDDGIVHTYLVTEGYIWTGQFPEAQRVIDKGNNQSMELDENSLQGTWTTSDNSNMEFFIINEAIISKLCILGEDFEPCFEGASIGKFSLDKDFHQRLYSLMKEVQKMKGGELSLMDEKLKELEGEQLEPVTEELADPPTEYGLDSETVTEEPQSVESVAEELAEEQHEDNTVQFSFDDFQKLKEDYSTLETSFNELQEKFNSMETNYNELLQFKQMKDKEEKQEMIDSFYMLSDEDKKDVQDNIDEYSVDEIEAKLSVICVHNKLDLSDKNKEETPETSFSLLDTPTMDEEENVPAWVSVLRKVKKNEN